ncbi:class I SAM-dependent methyltransferase [Streptomyces sp. LZ34]
MEVGCGTGRFARLLAGRGLDVEGVDADADVIGAARAAGGGPRYRRVDMREARLPESRYEFISCIASLHHMPFDSVLTLRKALAPGGVLAVLGLYSIKSAADQIPMVWPPPLTYAETRAEAVRLLPGSTLRRLLFWRYLLVYRA